MIVVVKVSKCILEEVSREIARVYIRVTLNGVEKKSDCMDYQYSAEMPIVTNAGR